MIDTINIGFEKFEIKGNNKLEFIKRSSNSHGDNNFQFAKAGGQNDLIKLNIVGQYKRICSVEFSVSKIFNNGLNYNHVSREHLVDVLDIVYRNILAMGIKVSKEDFLKSRLRRVDLFLNIETDYDFIFYANIFDKLEIPKKIKRPYPYGYYWTSISEEICVYNKKQEIGR